MIFDHTTDPLRVWQYAERYLGVGTRGYSSFSGHLDISERHHPQLGADRFTVATFRVPYERGGFLGNAVESTIAKLYRGGEAFLLPVHPDTLAHPGLGGRDALRERGPDLTVVPSANARTVFVERIGGEPVEPHFVKLHYPRRLSRFTRRLRRPIISVQLWVAEELLAIGLPVLPEVAAGVLGDDPEEAWGFLLREACLRSGPPAGPRGPLRSVGPEGPGGSVGPVAWGSPMDPVGLGGPGGADGLAGLAGGPAFGADPPPYTVPLFALYGQDFRRPGDPVLMAQLIARSGEDPAGWLARRVVAPMVGLWVQAVSRTGCVPEPHGQNTLFAFAADARRTAILYRDCGIYIDPQVRRDRGLDRELPPVNVISRDIHQPRERVFSLTYDSFMGHHALGRLAQVAAGTLGVDPAELRRAAREAFAAYGGAAVPLPGSVYYYEDRLNPDGGWDLVDTGERPAWRAGR